MPRTYIRWLLLVGLAAFVPLFYFLAVVGGLLPYGGIMLVAIRNLGNASLLGWSFLHLTVYGAAHGQIHWMNAYALYASSTLR